MQNRVFVPQDTLDAWLSDGRVEVEGEVMILKPEGQRFQLRSAVHFLQEVAGGGDGPALVGKVKDLEQLAELGGEHCADSVILGDNAYQVVEGFAGDPLFDESPSKPAGTVPPARAGDDVDLLARFFLSPR